MRISSFKSLHFELNSYTSIVTWFLNVFSTRSFHFFTSSTFGYLLPLWIQKRKKWRNWSKCFELNEIYKLKLIHLLVYQIDFSCIFFPTLLDKLNRPSQNNTKFKTPAFLKQRHKCQNQHHLMLGVLFIFTVMKVRRL